MITVFFRKWYRTKSPFQWLIGLATFGKYSHCAVLLSDGLSVLDASPKGVRVVPAKHYDDCNRLEINEKYDYRAESWGLRQVGKRYDWKGIFLSEIFPLGKHNQADFFCSELVAQFLEKSGIDLDAQPFEISPNRLYTILSNNYERLEDDTNGLVSRNTYNCCNCD